MQFLSFLISISALFLMSACDNNSSDTVQQDDTTGIISHTGITRLPDAIAFQDTIDGKKTNLFVLKNNNIDKKKVIN